MRTEVVQEIKIYI